MERMTLVVRHRADGHLGEKAVVVKELAFVENLVDDFLRAADEERAMWCAGGVEMLARRRRPAALPPDMRHDFGVRREERVRRLAAVGRDEGVRVDADARGAMPCPPAFRLRDIADERRELSGLAADDGEDERKAERAGANNRLGRTADSDPDRKRLLNRARIDAEVLDRRPVFAGPVERRARAASGAARASRAKSVS